LLGALGLGRTEDYGNLGFPFLDEFNQAGAEGLQLLLVGLIVKDQLHLDGRESRGGEQKGKEEAPHG
jgi:hypothetical protein